jgi:hypothetical protein
MSWKLMGLVAELTTKYRGRGHFAQYKSVYTKVHISHHNAIGESIDQIGSREPIVGQATALTQVAFDSASMDARQCDSATLDERQRDGAD